MPMLKDRLDEVKKAIDVKRAEVETTRKAFNDKKTELANATDIDITNPEDPYVKAADEAMKPYSKAADELRVLEGQFERIALMAADGSEKSSANVRHENELDRDPALYKALRENFGRKAIESETYKAAKADGVFSDGSEAPLPKGALAEMDADGFKSLITGTDDASGGVTQVPQRFPGIYDLPQLPLGIFNLITVGGTQERSVEFVRLLSRTIRAAETPEASTSADIDATATPPVTAADAGLAPESDLQLDVINEAVKAIKHFMPATRAMLADEPLLETLINSELLDGVQRRAETQVMQGDATGENIRGIYNTTGRATYTQGAAAAGEPQADAVHRIFTMLRLAGYEPSALAINPNDWQDIRLFKDANGNYQFGPPSIAGGNQIWGVPAVQTIAATAKRPVAGEWRRALFLVREGAKVYVSDSHKDWFLRGILALLAEARGVLIIPRPQAFGEVDLT